MSGYGGALGGGRGPDRDADPLAHTSFQQEQAYIAACQTEAAAQFVVVTLAAHGVQAATHAYFHAIPSVDWVEGFRIGVAEEDVAEARRILQDLSRDDVAPLDD